jgi:hypothetical protein
MNSNIFGFFTSSAGVLSKTAYFTCKADNFQHRYLYECCCGLLRFPFLQQIFSESFSFTPFEDSTGTSDLI